MSYSRINKGLGSADAGGGGLTDAQTALLANLDLGDLEDFTGDLPNYYPLSVPTGQESGGDYEVTTYSASSTGLTLTTSTIDTAFEGTNLSKGVGFYRIANSADLDVAIDVSGFTNIPSATGNKWHVLLAVCEGGTGQKNAIFAARLQQTGGGSPSWKAGRMISPPNAQKFDGGGAFEDEDTLASAPTSIRLRVEKSVANTGYKAYYSLDDGDNYTALEGSDGGTGWFQMHTRDSNAYAYGNRYSVGGPLMIMVACGQNLNTTDSSKQGSAKIVFKDLS